MLTNLRTLREAAGWSRWDLAQASGVSQETIEQAEMRGTNPRIDTVAALAKALHVPIEKLLGR